MRELIRFAARHPWPLLLLLLTVSFAAAVQLPNLKFNISAQGMMLEDGVDVEFYQQTLDTFGSEDVTILLVSDPQLFSPDKLKRIKSAVKDIESLAFVSRTDSLFSIKFSFLVSCREIEFTQCLVFFGVKPSPSKT